MPLQPPDLIEIRRSEGRGRGVFARKFIPSGAIIERVPVIVFPAKEILIDGCATTLYHYCFEWGKETVALALGYGSVYNHSYSPNARYDDVAQRTKVYSAIKDIQAGEEITINYNGDPDDRSPMEFDVT